MTHHNDKPLITVLIAAAFALIGMNAALITRNIDGDIKAKVPVVATSEEAEDEERGVLEFKEGESRGSKKGRVPGFYQVTMNSTWNFPNGGASSDNAYVANDKKNETPIYFDVVLRETGEQIYQSPVLDLGDSIRGISLDKKMKAGSYDCLMQIYLLDEDGSTLTTVRMGLRINIEG